MAGKEAAPRGAERGNPASDKKDGGRRPQDYSRGGKDREVRTGVIVLEIVVVLVVVGCVSGRWLCFKESTGLPSS